jgi:hypothetical protein
MARVLLLEGPEGNRYKGTLLSNGIWSVEPFLNLRSLSKWWKTQCYNHWREQATYTNEKLNETFTILAETNTHIEPCATIIHWD